MLKKKEKRVEKDLLLILRKILNLKKFTEIQLKRVHKNDIKHWDSLITINLIVALEENFKIKFSDNEAVKLISYPLILQILKKKI